MCFVNKLDRTGADFFRCVDMMVSRLNATPLVLQLPIGSESDFIGVIDLVGMRALTWRGETVKGEDYTVEENLVSLKSPRAVPASYKVAEAAPASPVPASSPPPNAKNKKAGKGSGVPGGSQRGTGNAGELEERNESASPPPAQKPVLEEIEDSEGPEY